MARILPLHYPNQFEVHSFDIFSEIVAIFFVTIMNILFMLVLPSDKQFVNTK